LLRRRVLAKPIQESTQTPPREKLITIGTKGVSHARRTTFEVAEGAIRGGCSRRFGGRIERLRRACVAD
jgi:hypothetical protein